MIFQTGWWPITSFLTNHPDHYFGLNWPRFTPTYQMLLLTNQKRNLVFHISTWDAFEFLKNKLMFTMIMMSHASQCFTVSQFASQITWYAHFLTGFMSVQQFSVQFFFLHFFCGFLKGWKWFWKGRNFCRRKDLK